MGKTHEALERADKEYHENYLKTEGELNKSVVSKMPGKYPMQASSDRYQEVKTRLITSFPIGSVKTILFTGTAHGDGCTTTAASFANTLTQNCRLNVLLIDANLRSPSLHEVFNIQYNHGLADLLTLEEGISLFKKVGRGNLYLIPCGKENSGPLTVFESRRFEKTLKLMREKFDYVILDAPPGEQLCRDESHGQDSGWCDPGH